MSIITWDRPHPKADEPSRLDRKAQRKAEEAANWRAVCRQVDTRDHYRCRACGVSCDTQGIDPLGKGHRHHLTFRSHGGQDVASNLLTLCARDHDAIHVKRTLRIDAMTPHGADGPLAFWREGGDGIAEYLSRREVRPGQVEKD